jgi:hypothetical protein
MTSKKKIDQGLTDEDCASLINSHRENLLKQWEQKIRKDFLESQHQILATLTDSIRSSLDQIGSKESKSISVVKLNCFTGCNYQSQFEDRIKTLDSSIPGLFIEYNSIKTLLFDLLETDHFVSPLLQESILSILSSNLINAAQGHLRELDRLINHKYSRIKLALVDKKTIRVDWNLLTGHLNWTESFKEIFTCFDHEQNFSIVDLWNRIYFEDRAAINEAINVACREGTKIILEFRVKWPDNSIHWILMQGHILLDNTGKPERLTASAVMLINKFGNPKE